MEDTGQIWIFTGNGDGTFQHTFTIPVGEEATGLTVVPGNGPGCSICWWAMASAMCCILEGKGDGTFQISGNRVSISVVPNLLGPGQAGVLVGDQQNDRVTVQAAVGQRQSVRAGGDSRQHILHVRKQLAPGDVQWAVLDAGRELCPMRSSWARGSNSVEIYRTIAITNGVPTFAPSPKTFFVGTAPASVTVADFNGDGVPDLLVADQGSNDVSEIFGSYNASGDWVGTLGPRLKSGGDGPIAVIVARL